MPGLSARNDKTEGIYRRRDLVGIAVMRGRILQILVANLTERVSRLRKIRLGSCRNILLDGLTLGFREGRRSDDRGTGGSQNNRLDRGTHDSSPFLFIGANFGHPTGADLTLIRASGRGNISQLRTHPRERYVSKNVRKITVVSIGYHFYAMQFIIR